MKQRKSKKQRKPKAPEGPSHTDTSLGATRLAWRAEDDGGQVVRDMAERQRRNIAAIASSTTQTVPVPPPQPITPTVYPGEPSGTVIVQNQITINVHSTDFRKFEAKLDELLEAIRRSNEISGEVRDQLKAEITAGRTLLKAPKADRTWIDFLLVRPLRYLAEKVGSAVISKLATDALEWLLKHLSP
jgi:hypothetical protein